jgi:hypothetical protein
MAILSRTITALLYLAWPLWAAPAFAASSTPAAPQKARQTADAKGYAFIDSHEEILAKAKKEGKLRPKLIGPPYVQATQKLTGDTPSPLIPDEYDEVIKKLSRNPDCSKEEVVYSLNGKYYKISRRQLRTNLAHVNSGTLSFTIPVTVPQWRVGPEDSHLNEPL